MSALVQAVKAHDRAADAGRAGQRRRVDFFGRRGRRSRRRAIASSPPTKPSTRSRWKATRRSSSIGNDDFPFAFPIVKTGERWHFDTEAGKDELLARRIGENELDADQGPAGDRRRAARLRVRGSQRRRRARLRAEVREQPRASMTGCTGRRRQASRRARSARSSRRRRPRATGRVEKGPTPYHGYYYRMLKGQGKSAEVGRGRLRRARARRSADSPSSRIRRNTATPAS